MYPPPHTQKVQNRNNKLWSWSWSFFLVFLFFFFFSCQFNQQIYQLHIEMLWWWLCLFVGLSTTRQWRNRNIHQQRMKCAMCTRSSYSLHAGVDPTTTNNLFQSWEMEEVAKMEEEMEKQRKKDKETVDDDWELPQYMLRALSASQTITNASLVSLPASKLPIVAVVGRPNTGKSTFVNKLCNTFKDGAIVFDEAGITRDRTYQLAVWKDYNFQVVDTGGIIFDDSIHIFAEQITEQALIAIKEANVVLFICDGQDGLMPLDVELGGWLRKSCKVPVFVVVNKCESEKMGMLQTADFWSLGLGTPHAVSAIHGYGINDLLDDITSQHLPRVDHVLPTNSTNVAFIGRPNVGKSSLFNSLYGSQRAIVSNIAGTTRDSVDAVITRGNRSYSIIDTAGIRRKPKVDYGAEFFMVNRAFKAIKRSDVIVLLLDAVDGVVDQDRILAERVHEEGRCCIIALNKWDLVPEKDDKTYLKAIENIRNALPSLRWAEIVLVSAKTGQRTEKILDSVDHAIVQYRRRIPTSLLNEIVHDAVLWLAPPHVGARSGRIYYTIQASSSPPTFVMFCNDPHLFTDTYKRYLERKLRDSLKFEGTPIRIIFRGKDIRDASRHLKRETQLRESQTS